MPIVTKLTPQRNKKFVNVYLDGKFEFGIDLDNLYKFGIKVEKNFSQEEIDEIIHAANFNKTLNKLLNFATLRPRSYKEINDWFFKKKTEKQIQEKLISKLEKLGLLDDEKFAKWWIRQRIEFKPRSKRALKFELLKKGISSNVIDSVLRNTEIDELELAKKLTETKLRSLERYDDEVRKKKLTNFLMGKGFSWNIVKEVLSGHSNKWMPAVTCYLISS